MGSGEVVIDLVEASTSAPQSQASPDNEINRSEVVQEKSIIDPPPIEPVPAPLIQPKTENPVIAKAKPPEPITPRHNADNKAKSRGAGRSTASRVGDRSVRDDKPRGQHSGQSRSSAIESVRAVPLYRENRQPQYPVLARKRGQEGKVILQVLVEASGRVGDLKIVQTSGYPSLDKAALDAVRHWKFSPGKQTGIPVPMWVAVPIVFSLN